MPTLTADPSTVLFGDILAMNPAPTLTSCASDPRSIVLVVPSYRLTCVSFISFSAFADTSNSKSPCFKLRYMPAPGMTANRRNGNSQCRGSSWTSVCGFLVQCFLSCRSICLRRRSDSLRGNFQCPPRGDCLAGIISDVKIHFCREIVANSLNILLCSDWGNKKGGDVKLHIICARHRSIVRAVEVKATGKKGDPLSCCWSCREGAG